MKLALCLLFATGLAAQAPLPGLRIEPSPSGSIVYVRNSYSQPLTAYLLEMVDYPGSSFSMWQDDVADPIPAGEERKYAIRSMLVGAAPDYMKIQAALYADGSSAGVPEKAGQLMARRAHVLETAREAIRRIEKAQASGTAKASIIADLKQWQESLRPAGKVHIDTQPEINRDAALTLVTDTIRRLDEESIEPALGELRRLERAIASSHPAAR